MHTEPQQKWKIDTNDRYNKIVTTVISLATGSFVLPILFLREFLGVRNGEALATYVNGWAYLGWGCLGFSILAGLFYSWLSVKWVKGAWGEPTFLSERCLEHMMDGLFNLMIFLFLAGISSIVWFFLHVAG